MGKVFEGLPNPISASAIIRAGHVSQSVDAFGTGSVDYDIYLTGSFNLTGSLTHGSIPSASGDGYSVLVRNNTTGEYYTTGSYGGGGASGTSGTSGANGSSGTSGANGSSGSSGTSGNGTSGTSGVSGGGSPGGLDTHIQYNSGSDFGGSAAFTFATGSQIVTINKTTTIASTTPHLKLIGTSSNAGAPSGVISAGATLSSTPPASFQFVNASAHGLGSYETDIVLKTAFGSSPTVERTALTLTASGNAHFGYDIFAPNLDNTAQANVVGFNSSTGQLTYFTTSSISGGGGLNLTRPGSPDQTIDFDEINVSDNEVWDYVTGGGVPASTKFTTDNFSPASITQFNISETSTVSGALTTKFATICSGGTITIGDDNNPTDTASYNVRQIIDQGSYYTIYVSNYIGGGLGTLVNGNGYRIGFDTDKQVVLDDQNYNRILIKNSTSSTKTVRFKANSAASAGDYYYVEITSDTGNADNMLLAYVFYTSGTTTTFSENKSSIYYNPNGTANTQLNLNTAAQQAIIEFRVTPSGDLALMGADKVIR